jgi:ABC-2 type transport system ATP-binding protein
VIRTPELIKVEARLKQSMTSKDGIANISTLGDRLEVLLRDAIQGKTLIAELLRHDQFEVSELTLEEPTLENVFVTLLQQKGSVPQSISFPRFGLQTPLPKRRGERSEVAIGCKDLNRHFGSFHAVVDLNLEIRYGEIYGLLGANGAGKTTAIKMLCGLLQISSGKVSLAGERGDLRSANLRQRIGYMSQKFTLYDDLTILENLRFYSGVYGIPPRQQRQKIDWVLAISGLEGQEHLLTKQLPGGWKQRVAFGASVMHEPEILFLDEPTSGADVLARQQFWQLINDFARNGTAILVTTHYMNEAEQCHRMCFMVAGRKVAEGSACEIKAAQLGQLFELEVEQLQASYDRLRLSLEPWRVSIFGNRLHVVLAHPNEELAQIQAWLQSAHLSVGQVHPIPFSLEDAFIGEVQRAGGAPP